MCTILCSKEPHTYKLTTLCLDKNVALVPCVVLPPLRKRGSNHKIYVFSGVILYFETEVVLSGSHEIDIVDAIRRRVSIFGKQLIHAGVENRVCIFCRNSW